MLHGKLRVLCVFILGLGIASVHGDVIILKDGFAIHGKVAEEQTIIFDNASGQGIQSRKANGFTTVDDGGRWTIFSAHFQAVGDVDPFNKYLHFDAYTRKYFQIATMQVPAVMTFQKATEFDANWHRILYFSLPNGVQDFPQQITELTPHYVRLRCTKYLWTCTYLTRELGFDRVRKLLSTHPDLIEKKGQLDPARRAKIIRFLIQAEWTAEAEDELKKFDEDFPNEKKRSDDFRNEIRDDRLESIVNDIDNARQAGRHGYAISKLKSLPEQLPAKLTVRVLAIRTEYEAKQKRFADAKRFLGELKEIAKIEAFLADGATMIERDLHFDTVNRLDTFLALAANAERDRKEGKKPLYTPSEILAAGISAWLQGQNSAQTKVEFTKKLLKARDVALSFLSTENPRQRAAILNEYLVDPEALPYDELEKLISLLPPPTAEKQLPSGASERKTEYIAAADDKITYLLRLPPEYSHGRPYPLLIVLPDAGQKLEELGDAVGELAAKQGYIVAVVKWFGPFNQAFKFQPEERACVTGVLRHLRRSFQIDSDRVFLYGYRDGATMALDVAAGNPDLFAGVIPMSGKFHFDYFVPGEYWQNFQHLPVYLVVGDRAGESIKGVREVYRKWMHVGFPSVAVSYKGRGNDWFGEEFPRIFDWMSRKTRAAASPSLTKEKHFTTLRADENRFYWVTLDEIQSGHLWQPKQPLPRFGGAKVSARIVEGNQIVVSPLGVNSLTVWLRQGMIDFAKPIVVKINDREVFKKTLTPKISVLLEDLYERGDRQRPALQRIDVSKLTGNIKAVSP